MPRRFPDPRRRLALALCAAGGAVLCALAAAGAAGLRVNFTASMPRGVWQVRTGAPVARASVVVICPPDRADIREAAERGYIAAGACPGGLEPLLKPVAAVAGDLVTVTPKVVAVNGQPIADTAPLAHDGAGRTLRPVPSGSYRVASGEVWVLSSHDPRSFDSRYFGPLPAAGVQGVARPVWVLP